MSDPVLPDESDDGPATSSAVTVVVDEWLRHVAGFVPIRAWQLPDLVGPDVKVSGEALRLYVILGQHARRVDRTAWPSNGRLSALLGASVRTVQRWLAELLAAGWVTSETTTTRGPQGHALTKRTLRMPLDRDTPPRQVCRGPHDKPGADPMTPMAHHPDESEPDESEPHPEGRGTPESQGERADPAASLWGRIQDTLAGAGCPIRGAPSAAHQGLYSFFRRPGYAPDPNRLVRSLQRDAVKWVARARDEVAAGSPDPWRFTPSLSKWIQERRWEIPDDPEPPGPPPTVSVPGVSRRELDAREEDMRRRREATARARGAAVSDLPRVDMPRSIGDSVKALARGKGLPS